MVAAGPDGGLSVFAPRRRRSGGSLAHQRKPPALSSGPRRARYDRMSDPIHALLARRPLSGLLGILVKFADAVSAATEVRAYPDWSRSLGDLLRASMREESPRGQ